VRESVGADRPHPDVNADIASDRTATRNMLRTR
jgi:hypothetical protein